MININNLNSVSEEDLTELMAEEMEFIHNFEYDDIVVITEIDGGLRGEVTLYNGFEEKTISTKEFIESYHIS